MPAHAKKSPSQAKRMRICVGALTLCDALPDYQRNQAGEAARIGTVVHAIIEHSLKHGKKPSALEGRVFELVGDDEDAKLLPPAARMTGRGRKYYIVDASMIDGATMMTNYVRKRCKKLGVDASALQLETRTNPLPDRDDTSGTADVTIDAEPVILEVVDYKNGYRVVEVVDNDQLLAYLLGKALEVKFKRDKFRITVVQPNCEHEEGRIRHFDYTKKELLAFQRQYRKTVERNDEAADDPRAPTDAENVDPKWAKKYLNAGDDAEHCTFCDAAAICPARLAFEQGRAGMDFADEPAELDSPQDESAAARILAWAPSLTNLIAAANAYAMRSIENGFAVPGFKIVRGRSVRELIDLPPNVIAKRIVRDKYVTDKAKLYSTPALLTGPQIEKLVAPKRRKKFAAKYLIKPEGKPTLVPDSDPRPAVEFHPGDDFNDTEDFG